jgi:hypothetical protein
LVLVRLNRESDLLESSKQLRNKPIDDGNKILNNNNNIEVISNKELKINQNVF